MRNLFGMNRPQDLLPAIKLDTAHGHDPRIDLITATDRRRQTEFGAADCHVRIRPPKPGNQRAGTSGEYPVEPWIGIFNADDSIEYVSARGAGSGQLDDLPGPGAIAEEIGHAPLHRC